MLACCLSRRRFPVAPNTTFPALALLVVPFAVPFGADDFACASATSTAMAQSLINDSLSQPGSHALS